MPCWHVPSQRKHWLWHTKMVPCSIGVRWSSPFHKPRGPWLVRPLKSVTHDQCDARPTVTFSAAEHYHPIAPVEQYQIMLLGDRGTRVCTTCPEMCSHTPTGSEVEPLTSWLQVWYLARCATVPPPLRHLTLHKFSFIDWLQLNTAALSLQ